MKITFNEVESILNTLPIGYYTSRRIPVNLDDKAATSYYLPVEDKIVIGFPLSNMSLIKFRTQKSVQRSQKNLL